MQMEACAVSYSFLTKSAKLKLKVIYRKQTTCYSFLTKSAKLKPGLSKGYISMCYSFLTKSAKLKQIRLSKQIS